MRTTRAGFRQCTRGSLVHVHWGTALLGWAGLDGGLDWAWGGEGRGMVDGGWNSYTEAAVGIINSESR